MRGKLPLRTRILTALLAEPDWDSITPEEVVAVRATQDRLRGSPLVIPLTGRPDRAARITGHTLELPGRDLDVRMYRPAGSTALPLVIAFHGGGFIGGAPDQDDWLLAHLAVHCPALIVSVSYRLAPEYPIPAPVQDAYDVLAVLAEQAQRWGGDPTRIAVLGSSAGATLAALTAIEAAEQGVALRCQVLINPMVDWTERAFEYPSFTENADSPTASPAQCRAARRLAVPDSFDPQVISPLHSAGLAGVAPALIQAAGLDPLEDQAHAYADHLRRAGAEVTLTRYASAVHSFLSLPGAVPAAKPARAEILARLRTRLTDAPASPGQRNRPSRPGTGKGAQP